jgi:hypothetical protein
MAYRKSRLKFDHQGLTVNADVRTAKLTPEALAERPEIIRRDERSGDLAVRQIYDKATGDPLEESYGYRWITEAGEEVPVEHRQRYVVEGDDERPFSKHEPTVGADRTLTAETWIPVATIDEYLIEDIYEIWAEEYEDILELTRLAEHIREFDEAPVVPFLLQPSNYKRWGIITPYFLKDRFALIIRVTDHKIEAEHTMPILTELEVAKAEARAEAEEAQPLEQESPFE